MSGGQAKVQWEQFRAPFIDMGVMGLGASREFRIDVTNMRYHMLELSFSTEGLEDTGERACNHSGGRPSFQHSWK